MSHTLPSRSKPLAGRVRVFLALSLDGFIAGEKDDLGWLPEPAEGIGDGGFSTFLEEVGALLMGRRTYDVVSRFEGPSPYGERPILVATHRTLDHPLPTARPVSGSIEQLVALGLTEAQGQDLYLDGGDLVRQAAEVSLVDEFCLTLIPIILGKGISLFHGLGRQRKLELLNRQDLPGGIVQLTYRPKKS